MARTPDWKRALDTGAQYTEMRRSQARKLASDLVAQGQLARDQVGAAVDEIVDASRRRREELRSVVGKEVQRQLGSLGLATKADLAALERRLGAKPTKQAAKKTAKQATTTSAGRPAAKKAAKKAGTAKQRAATPARTRARNAG